MGRGWMRWLWLVAVIGLASCTPQAARRPAADGQAPQLLWPVAGGKLSSRFGARGGFPHEGIDIVAPAGTPIRAAAAGIVSFAGVRRGYGRFVVVFHAPGFSTAYGHNRSLLVSAGDRVRRGQVLATLGSTGRATGPNLHFEVRRAGEPVDPLRYFRRSVDGARSARRDR